MSNHNGNQKLFWGDIHAHSGYSGDYWPGCGEGSLDQFYTYARDEAGLDFCAATNHGFTMTDTDWEDTQRKSAAYNEPGRFATFTAYEWTSWVYGHHNVYYLTDEGELHRSTESGNPRDPDSDTPEQLFRKLRGTGREVMVVPHHPALTQFRVNWDFYDPELEPLVEITSLWGNFEYYGNPHRSRISDVLPGYYAQDALKRGYRLGFLGGTDSHDCRPGSHTFGGRRKPNGREFSRNPLGVEIASHISDETANWRGLTAVYADVLTREAIFGSLQNRRCYATTGARIQLEFRVNGHLMGEAFRVHDPGAYPKIEVRVRGPERIEMVEVVRNGDVIYGKRGTGPEEKIDFVDRNIVQRENYYYVRVLQADGHRAWSSPIWVEWDCLPDLRVEAKLAAGGVEVVLENRGRSDTGSAVLRCYREYPFTIPSSDPEPAHPEGGWGTTLQRERVGDRVRLLVRWHGGDETRNFEGQISLVGWSDYRVRDVGFECVKYGGDLFTDDGGGQIRWNVTAHHRPKGLDITVMPDPYARCSAFVDPTVGGQKLASQVRLEQETVPETPFEVLLADYREEAQVGGCEVVGPKAGETCRVTVKCLEDAACVVVDSGYGPPIVEALPWFLATIR